jgi:FkbH-like protein
LFVDDSTFEILEVTNEIPQIKSLLLDQKVENRSEQISSLGIKWASGSTIEDVNRTDMIKQNIQRDEAIARHASKDVLESLELNLEIRSISDESDHRFPRILQLINKTNQFNMTCERFTETELIKFLKKGKIYSGSLADKFGDYGLIAVVLVEFPDRSTAHFVNFLVSCRALGRKVEEAMISELVRDLQNRGITKIVASWKENPKNIQTKDFYSIFGFRLHSDPHSPSEIQFELETFEPIADKQLINVTNFIS